MNKILKGECLCGTIKFELEDDFHAFHLCHCKQCQQQTGSAFASNIFTTPENINWTEGEDQISVYEHQTRDFSKSFCKHCGSAVPFLNKTGRALIVPAGSLSDDASIVPKANIFNAERACWLSDGIEAKLFDGFRN
ncbi:MAG: GFA family protein [Kangiellaceae bacterium]|nr:GFA family protein [Kangiellaceae bacterium]